MKRWYAAVTPGLVFADAPTWVRQAQIRKLEDCADDLRHPARRATTLERVASRPSRRLAPRWFCRGLLSLPGQARLAADLGSGAVVKPWDQARTRRANAMCSCGHPVRYHNAWPGSGRCRVLVGGGVCPCRSPR